MGRVGLDGGGRWWVLAGRSVFGVPVLVSTLYEER
jgi:hypothetical protein